MNIFNYGFRIFFFLSGAAAVLLVLGWLRVLFHGGLPSETFDPLAWHAHEMLFGFVSAMIAGFLLTAVPNWTGEKAKSGLPLMLLSGLWLLARLMLCWGSSRQAGIVDLTFYPALVLLLAPSLLRRKQVKSLVFLPILTVLWIANLLTYLQAWGVADTLRAGQALAVGTILLLITIIGGRVIPFFTSSALKTVAKKWAFVETLAIITVLLLPFLDVFQLPAVTVVGWSVLATLSHGARLWGWTSRKIWTTPLLWVIHTGYAWLVVGLALKGAAAVGLVPPSSALHAFTAGTMGVVGLAIMARASLGHSGRPLVPAKLTTCSFVLVNLAALIRVMGPILGLNSYVSYGVSGLFWCSAFTLFLWVYAPIFFSARADGKPG